MYIPHIQLARVNANHLQAALIVRAHQRQRFGALPSLDATAARWIAARATTFRAFYVRHAAGRV